VGPCPLVRL